MKVAIDFRNKCNNDNALRMFTGEFWQDIALLQPGHDFIFITSENMTPKQPVKNVHTRRLKKTNFQWIDQKRLGKMLTEWQADRLVTIQETGFSISNNFQKKNYKKPAAQPGRQVLFATGKIA